MAIPGRKSKGFKWWFFFGFTGAIDVLQILIDLTGIGVILSEIIEIAMPFILIPAFQFSGISLISRPTRILSMGGALGLDAITGGAAPFWILDIWYIYMDVKKEDAEYLEQQKQEQMTQMADFEAYNVEGVRAPRMELQQNGDTSTSSSARNARIINVPFNYNGARAPRKETNPLVNRSQRGNLKPSIGSDVRPPKQQEVSLSE